MAEVRIKTPDGNNHVGLATANLSGDVTLTLPKASLDLSTAGTDGQFLKTDGAGTLSFATVDTDPTTTSGTNNFTVADGDLVIGTSGHGISFAATSDGGTVTPDETLKDYEEGEWTPVWKQGSNEFTHDRQQGYYTRIGNLCYAWWNYTWTNKGSASGNMTLAGFPFQGKSNAGQFYYVGINSNSAWTADDYSDLTWQVLLTGNETSAIGGFQPGAGNYLTAADCLSLIHI